MAKNLGPRTSCAHCGSVLMICQNPACAKAFPRRDDESDARWGARQYCTPLCANKMRQKLIHGDRVAARKPCGREGCEEEAVQRPTESPASFEARKYHDARCSQLARRQGVLSQKEQRVVNRENRDERWAAAAAARKLKREQAAAEAAERMARPLIRPDVKPQAIEPRKDVWRPAAWQEADRRFA
jgi:hypothetical protein